MTSLPIQTPDVVQAVAHLYGVPMGAVLGGGGQSRRYVEARDCAYAVLLAANWSPTEAAEGLLLARCAKRDGRLSCRFRDPVFVWRVQVASRMAYIYARSRVVAMLGELPPAPEPVAPALRLLDGAGEA